MKYLNQNLTFLRKKIGFKQAEMLDTLGFKRTTWATWELGYSEPSIDKLLKIVEYFGVTLDEIVTEDLEAKGKVDEKTESLNNEKKGKEKRKVYGKVYGKNPIKGVNEQEAGQQQQPDINAILAELNKLRQDVEQIKKKGD